MLKYDQQVADELVKRIHEQMNKGVYTQITAHLSELAEKHTDKKGDFKISIDQRCCPVCYEATFVGSVHRKSGSDWSEIENLKFRYDTQPEYAEEEGASVE